MRSSPSARLRLDALESRLSPATLVNPTTLTYQDVDGDKVTVKFSKPILNANNVDSIFTFNSGAVNGSNASPQSLQRITLTGVSGAGLTNLLMVSDPTASGGDGHAALGEIDATGLDLGDVAINGDLGRILAGDATTTTTGLKSLAVFSMGRFGASTGATNLNTLIQGRLGALTVKGDVKEAFVNVAGGADGDIGPVKIVGSLLGGAASDSGKSRHRVTSGS